jgi:para-nitrobenzyl esterase
VLITGPLCLQRSAAECPLAKHMMDAWIAFAKCGDPSHPGIGAWPAYGTASRHTMIFGRSCGVSEAPFEEERAIWADVLGAS